MPRVFINMDTDQSGNTWIEYIDDQGNTVIETFTEEADAIALYNSIGTD
jgi:hypothetical protein